MVKTYSSIRPLSLAATKFQANITPCISNWTKMESPISTKHGVSER